MTYTKAMDADERAQARDRAKRYRARKRGENVPRRKPGPRPTDKRAKPLADWEDFLRDGNKAGFLGSENGYSAWILVDTKTETVRTARFPDGPETLAAIEKIVTSPMNIGVLRQDDKSRLADLIQEAIDTPSPPWRPSAEMAPVWTPDTRRLVLGLLRDLYRYDRIVPPPGVVYHRVDGSKLEEGGSSQEQAAPGADVASESIDSQGKGRDDDAQS